ncbi:hypothetical protein B0T21DRAFT_383093 [Apiosordaria backusii]|uniref:Uncharacterized protein n=1 Tax=Apiosordaria backusii TaxID=314023 RepID=A0AA40BMR7_9PEZI|nr:hypothetical protein B0T21DRAFT_383093 [Apiosordaria backusii]
MQRSREISAPSLASFVSGGTSQSGRRIAARELFEQYNISRPSEIENIGVGQDPKDTRTRSRKSTVTVCHICGDRVRPQLYCPSCGHPLCGRCKKDTAQQNKQELGSVNGSSGGEQHELGPEDEVEGVSVAVATGLPSPVATTPPDEEQPGNTGVAGEGDKQVEVIRKPKGEIITVEKRRPVKTNPFVIADQIAKAKVSDPQVSSTTIHVVPTPPGSKPPKYDLTTAVDRKRRGPDASTDAAEHPRTRQSQWEPHLGRLSHSYASSSRGSSAPPASSPRGPSTNLRMVAAAEEREKERMAALHAKASPHVHRQDREPDRTTPSPSSQASNDRAHVVKQQAKREKERSTPPVLRRVKVLAQRDRSGTLQQVLQVDVDSGGPDNRGMEGGGRDSPKSIPRVRVTSPPAWLKNPSATAVAQPGSIAGRLRRVDVDKAMDSSKTKSSPQLYQPAKEKEERDTSDSTATVTVIRSGQPADTSADQQRTSFDPRAGGFGTNVLPRATGRGGRPPPGNQQASQPPRSYPLPPMQQSLPTAGPSQPQSILSGPAFGQQHSHGSGFWKVPSSVNMASKTTSEATIDGSRFGGGGPSHRGGGRGGGGGGTGTLMVEGDDDDDVGIQGLTIVLHLRGKDDLVISTDLTREGGGVGGGGNGSSVRSSRSVGMSGMSGQRGVF